MENMIVSAMQHAQICNALLPRRGLSRFVYCSASLGTCWQAHDPTDLTYSLEMTWFVWYMSCLRRCVLNYGCESEMKCSRLRG